mmetsp:Transcript_19020/g.45404  ORF Transcript_19020/g.45404 Transcript_19020/m.45404 type:complete len:459 (-) Transcript_19020:26-1402(-)
MTLSCCNFCLSLAFLASLPSASCLRVLRTSFGSDTQFVAITEGTCENRGMYPIISNAECVKANQLTGAVARSEAGTAVEVVNPNFAANAPHGCLVFSFRGSKQLVVNPVQSRASCDSFGRAIQCLCRVSPPAAEVQSQAALEPKTKPAATYSTVAGNSCRSAGLYPILSLEECRAAESQLPGIGDLTKTDLQVVDENFANAFATGCLLYSSAGENANASDYFIFNAFNSSVPCGSYPSIKCICSNSPLLVGPPEKPSGEPQPTFAGALHASPGNLTAGEGILGTSVGGVQPPPVLSDPAAGPAPVPVLNMSSIPRGSAWGLSGNPRNRTSRSNCTLLGRQTNSPAPLEQLCGGNRTPDNLAAEQPRPVAGAQNTTRAAAGQGGTLGGWAGGPPPVSPATTRAGPLRAAAQEDLVSSPCSADPSGCGQEEGSDGSVSAEPSDSSSDSGSSSDSSSVAPG